MKRPRGYYVDPKDEEFNLLFREGGGYPVEDNTANRDCISQMMLVRSRSDVLRNALRDMRCDISERVETGCGGGDLFQHSHSIEPPEDPGEISWLMTPMISRDRRFMIRVPRDPKPISKPLQQLSAIALMLLAH